MKVNLNKRMEANPGTEQIHEVGIRVRELTEDEIVARILERSGPGSLLHDLDNMPPVPNRIRLR